MDVPNPRSSHSEPTPRGAGVALAFAVCATFAAASAAGRQDWLALLAAPAVVAAIGLADDIRSLPSVVRLTVHLAAAAVVVWGGARGFAAADFAGARVLAAVLALVWLVGMTNAYNFMDGIDGLAGAQAVVAGVGWLVLGRIADEPTLALLGALIASACTGFLLLNWPPARIFMGDVGSGFLGFTLAVMTVLGARHDSVLAACGLLLVWPFVCDATFTLGRRLIRGENILRAHRSHVYQRLVMAGLSHRRVTLIYTGLAVVGSIGAFALAARVVWATSLVIALMALFAAGLYACVRRLESSGRSPVWSVHRHS